MHQRFDELPHLVLAVPGVAMLALSAGLLWVARRVRPTMVGFAYYGDEALDVFGGEDE